MAGAGSFADTLADAPAGTEDSAKSAATGSKAKIETAVREAAANTDLRERSAAAVGIHRTLESGPSTPIACAAPKSSSKTSKAQRHDFGLLRVCSKLHTTTMFGAIQYLKHNLYHHPLIFTSSVIAIAGPILLAVVYPIRREMGYKPSLDIPKTYPGNRLFAAQCFGFLIFAVLDGKTFT
eukprot:jgi/Hompol1/6631/HPOL_001977-RA